MVPAYLSATRFARLNRRTFYGGITAIDTTVALFWLKSCLAICTLVEKLAGISWHGFFLSVSANRAGNY